MAMQVAAGYIMPEGTVTDIDIDDPEYYLNYVKSLTSYQKIKMQSRNNKIQDMYDHRYGRHSVAIPDAFRATASEYKSPLIRDIIRRAVAITNDFPEPRVHPRKKLGPKSQENSSLRERFAAGWLRCANRSKDVWGMIRDDAATAGCAVWKVIFREHYWTSYGLRRDGETAQLYNKRVQEHRQEHFPFIWEHVETSTWYPVAEDEDGLCETLEITRRETLPMMNKYGLQFTQGRFSKGVGQVLKEPGDWSTMPDTVEFIEYWNRNIFCYIVAGVMVKAGYHDYGRPPYFYAMASTTGSKNPVDQYESIATPLVAIQDLQDSFTTIRMNWAYINGFPAARLVPISDEVVEVPDISTIKYVPGETIQAPAGYKWEWVPAPPVGDDLRFLSEWLEKQADTFSLAPILYGLPAGANVSGVATLQLIAIAKSLFAPALENLARAMNDTMSFVLYLIEHVIQAPVPVYYQGDEEWVELGPSDIDGYYEFDFRIEPVIQAERIARSQWLSDLEARGMVTKEHVLEEGAGIHDPEVMLDKVRIQKFRERADYEGGVFQEAMRQLELEDYFTPPQPQPTPGMPVGPGGIGIPMQQGIQLPLPGMMPGVPGQMAMPNAEQAAGRQGGTPPAQMQQLF